MKPVSEKLLSPKLLTEGDHSYESVKELKAAVELEACKNIAVTGINGAGKSSVINTFASEYQSEHPQKRLLRISLSTFDLNNDKRPSEAYENDIEYKLVQQILYRSNPEELYQSSFKRIHYRPFESITCLAIKTVLSIAALIILFEPNFLRIDSLYGLYFSVLGPTVGKWINWIFDAVSLAWLIYVSYLVITWSIKRISAISSLKLKAKDFEVEASKDSSVFNKMLEELNYYFRAGKYDVVVIEDLDRLKNPAGLFLKIRELNIMLNESYEFLSAKKTLKFIYAVKDDLFQSDIRVKFFDYIVPVVPIIDSYNAADFIIEKRSDIYEGKESFKEDIPEIVLYVNEMRVLKNVINEFEIYQKTILEGRAHMSESKLLAMIVYKNLWPDNYSKLHSRSSILNLFFDNPKAFVNKLFSTKIDRLSLITNEIEALESEAKSIRKDFVDYIEQQHNVEKFFNNTMSYSLSDLIENDYAFLKLQQDQFEKYYYVDRLNREGGTLDRDFTFEDIENAVDGSGSKIYRLGKLREQLQRLEFEKSDLNKELAHKRASSYFEIFKDVDGELALNCIKEYVGKDIQNELSEFILSMLRKGYIAEDYHAYISFGYEGTISNKDRDFINAVLQGRSLDYDYKLDDPEEVRKSLQKEDNYEGNSILNFSFIAYLIDAKDSILDRVTEVARHNWLFIQGCDVVGDKMATFLKRYVFKGWYNCLKDIFNGDKKNLSERLQVFFHYCPDDVSLSDELKESLASMYEVIANGTTSKSASLVASWMSSKKIVFKTLRAPLTDYERPLFDAVLKNGLFKITKDNLQAILGKQFDLASYTTICNYDNDSLIEYLVSNIHDTVQSFPDTSINEEEEYLKDLLSYNEIDGAWMKQYLEKQKCILQDFEDVQDNNIDLILELGKVKATWSNIYVVIEKDRTGYLHNYLSENISDFVGQKCDLEHSKCILIEKVLFANNDFLTIDEYRSLIQSFSAPMVAEVIDGLDGERMMILVQNDLVSFNESGIKLLSTYETPIIAKYIVNHFEEYKEIADEDDDFRNNEFGVIIMESSLSDEQKTYYLDYFAPTKIDDDDYYRPYSILICQFLSRVGVTTDTDIKLAVNALVGYSGLEGWLEKITLINKINAHFEYDRERETKMINALDGGYPQLNSYYGTIALDANPQNKELLEFLVANGHYVNRFYLQEDGRLKVTFKREPNR